MRTANTRIIFDDDEILGSKKKETAKFKIKSSAMNKLAQKSRIKPSSSQAGL